MIKINLLKQESLFCIVMKKGKKEISSLKRKIPDYSMGRVPLAVVSCFWGFFSELSLHLAGVDDLLRIQ